MVVCKFKINSRVCACTGMAFMCVVCGDDLIEKKRFEKQRLASLSESLFNALENVMKEIDERRLVSYM